VELPEETARAMAERGIVELLDAPETAAAPAPETAAVEAPAQAALAEPDDGTPAFIPPAIAHPPEIPEFLPPGTGRA
jgi:hypothetical protein